MTHTFKIKDTAKSRPLLAYLRTLSFVKFVEKPEHKVEVDAEITPKKRKTQKKK